MILKSPTRRTYSESAVTELAEASFLCFLAVRYFDPGTSYHVGGCHSWIIVLLDLAAELWCILDVYLYLSCLLAANY